MKMGIRTYSAEIGSDSPAGLALRTQEAPASLDRVVDVGVDRSLVWSILGTSPNMCQKIPLCIPIVDGYRVKLLRKYSCSEAVHPMGEHNVESQP
jgi:hypothetical protein